MFSDASLFLTERLVGLILGDNLFYGAELLTQLHQAMTDGKGASIWLMIRPAIV